MFQNNLCEGLQSIWIAFNLKADRWYKLSLQLNTFTLPPCRIRQSCRWWLQEGKAACFRCPQVVTDDYNPSEIMAEVAEPVV